MSRVDVDPVTGQPRQTQQQTAEERDHKEKIRLEALGRHTGISQSEAAQVMIALAEEALIKRVEGLLVEDNACKVLLDVLRAIGNIEFTAAQAVKKLSRRQVSLNTRSAGH